MDTEILVVGAGPAGLAAAATLMAQGARRARHREGRPGRRVVAPTLRAAAPAHRQDALDTARARPFPPARRAMCRARASSTTSTPTPRGRHRAALRRRGDGDRARRRWRLAHDDARRRNDPRARRRRHTGANNQFRSCRRSTATSASPARSCTAASTATRRAFAGQRVLVVGMGNTGAEIALDLAEHGVAAALSVRSPVNIVHRDVLGAADAATSLLLARLPHRARRRGRGGLLRRHGRRHRPLWPQRSPISPLRELREHGRTPVIDVGTLARIRRRRDRRLSRRAPPRARPASNSSTAASRRSTPSSSRPAIAPASRRSCRLRGAARRQRPAALGVRRGRARGPLLHRLRHASARRPAAYDRPAGAGRRRADRGHAAGRRRRQPRRRRALGSGRLVVRAEPARPALAYPCGKEARERC